MPANFLSLNESTSSFAFCPACNSTMSISPMSTRASIWLKSEMVMISVPAFCTVPSTRSPSCEFSLVIVPSSGAGMLVLSIESCALSTAALASSTE